MFHIWNNYHLYVLSWRDPITNFQILSGKSNINFIASQQEVCWLQFFAEVLKLLDDEVLKTVSAPIFLEQLGNNKRKIKGLRSIKPGITMGQITRYIHSGQENLIFFSFILLTSYLAKIGWLSCTNCLKHLLKMGECPFLEALFLSFNVTH